MENNNHSDKNISDEVVDLVIARLETIPSNISISIGSEGSFNVYELIERVKARDEIGKKMIEMQLQYIRSLKNYSSLNDNSHHEAIIR